MQKLLKLLLIIILSVIILFLYCCLKIAKISDDESDNM